MAKEHFRGVIWPRPADAEHKNLHRYIVIGMLVSDQPIENFHPNETLLDGPTKGLVKSIKNIKQKKPKFTLGDANMVLTNLNHICDDE